MLTTQERADLQEAELRQLLLAHPDTFNGYFVTISSDEGVMHLDMLTIGEVYAINRLLPLDSTYIVDPQIHRETMERLYPDIVVYDWLNDTTFFARDGYCEEIGRYMLYVTLYKRLYPPTMFERFPIAFHLHPEDDPECYTLQYYAPIRRNWFDVSTYASNVTLKEAFELKAQKQKLHKDTDYRVVYRNPNAVIQSYPVNQNLATFL